jgi:hypothetical protein
MATFVGLSFGPDLLHQALDAILGGLIVNVFVKLTEDHSAFAPSFGDH